MGSLRRSFFKKKHSVPSDTCSWRAGAGVTAPISSLASLSPKCCPVSSGCGQDEANIQAIEYLSQMGTLDLPGPRARSSGRGKRGSSPKGTRLENASKEERGQMWRVGSQRHGFCSQMHCVTSDKHPGSDLQ